MQAFKFPFSVMPSFHVLDPTVDVYVPQFLKDVCLSCVQIERLNVLISGDIAVYSMIRFHRWSVCARGLLTVGAALSSVRMPAAVAHGPVF